MSEPFKMGAFERIILSSVLFVIISILGLVTLALMIEGGNVPADERSVIANGFHILLAGTLLALFGRPVGHYAKRAALRSRRYLAT